MRRRQPRRPSAFPPRGDRLAPNKTCPPPGSWLYGEAEAGGGGDGALLQHLFRPASAGRNRLRPRRNERLSIGFHPQGLVGVLAGGQGTREAAVRRDIIPKPFSLFPSQQNTERGLHADDAPRGPVVIGEGGLGDFFKKGDLRPPPGPISGRAFRRLSRVGNLPLGTGRG